MLVGYLLAVLFVVALAGIIGPSAAPAGAAQASATGIIPSTILEQDEALERLLVVRPSASMGSTPQRNSILEQGELLERLLAENHFATVVRDVATPICDFACFQVMFQQMWDLAEQVRQY